MKTKKVLGYGLIAVVLVLAFIACKDDPDPAHVHDYEWTVITPATCIATGEETGVCKLDPSHTTTRVIPIDLVNGHDWDFDNAEITDGHAPTCTTPGDGTIDCKRKATCGGSRSGAGQIPINPNAHDWGTTFTILPATETKNSVKAILCNRDPSHTKDEAMNSSETGFEYATGTAGLVFVLLDSGGNSGTYRVSKGTTGSKSAIHIPAYWRGNSANYEDYLPVTTISNGSDAWNDTAFGGTRDEPNTTLTSITFAAESQLTTISYYAFYNCTSLTSITIPASVTFIGYQAFQNCTSLTSITIPANVTSIDGGAFQNCTSLTSITIPASVTSIGGGAFQNCTSLTSITIPASVTSIGDGAFQSCTSLTSITVDANNPNYASQDGILYNKAKTAIVAIPAGISGSITIPAGVTSIGNAAFSGCRNLTSVTFAGENLLSIGEGTFYDCSSLASVTIPASVTSIGNWAFYGCNSLTSVTIPEGVTSIGNWAFYGCNSLTSVTIPEGVTSIGDNVFNECTSLTSITIPASVTSIGERAFRLCQNLTSITIPAGVTSIGSFAFTLCQNLTSITIPTSVTTVGNNAFQSWFNPQTIYIEGHASEVAADTAWGENWRQNCYAVIKYWNGSSYQ